MTRATFTPEEWASIAAILRPKPEEEPKLRRALLFWREYAQERAGIRVDQHRKAVADLTALRDALAALAVPLARAQRDAAPGMLSESVRKMRAVWGAKGDKVLRRFQGVDSTAMMAIRGVIIRSTEPEKVDAAPFATDADVQRFAADAQRLHELADAALRSLGTMKEGRPVKAPLQRQAVRGLADIFQKATGKRATQSETGPFVELVRLVLDLDKAGRLLAGLSPAKAANQPHSRKL